MSLFTDKQFFIIIGLIAVALYLVTRAAGKAADTAVEVAESLNPIDPNNVINQGVQNVLRAVTGEPNFKLGGWLYDVLNDPVDPLTTHQGGA